jgi:gamma-glutamylcyclotransferase (GGCT)/AIG2-like uncharacterized protein YtfP
MQTPLMPTGVEHPDHLFVYGTLLPELAPAAWRGPLSRCARVGRGSLPGRLYDLGDYPALVPEPSAPGRVVGQVLRLPEREGVLAELDGYEGFDPADPAGSLFLRLPHAVDVDDGTRLACWVYVYNRDPGGATPIPEGDFLSWLHRGTD